MSRFKLGKYARLQLLRFASEWKKGEHVFISGGTESGKTLLARYLDEIRLHAGGRVVVFVAKAQPDATILQHYSKEDGWIRLTRWPDRMPRNVRKVLLWPDVAKKTPDETRTILKREFKRALERIFISGDWTIHIDEGLYTVDPGFGLGLGQEIATLSQMVRTAGGTLIVLMQRPAHMPLAVFANSSYGFVNRAPMSQDLERVAEISQSIDKNDVKNAIRKNGKHDFTLIRAASGGDLETFNLSR